MKLEEKRDIAETVLSRPCYICSRDGVLSLAGLNGGKHVVF